MGKGENGKERKRRSRKGKHDSKLSGFFRSFVSAFPLPPSPFFPVQCRHVQ